MNQVEEILHLLRSRQLTNEQARLTLDDPLGTEAYEREGFSLGLSYAIGVVEGLRDT